MVIINPVVTEEVMDLMYVVYFTIIAASLYGLFEVFFIWRPAHEKARRNGISTSEMDARMLKRLNLAMVILVIALAAALFMVKKEVSHINPDVALIVLRSS